MRCQRKPPPRTQGHRLSRLNRRGWKRSRLTESQSVSILNGGEAWVGVARLARKYGISRATYFNWRPKYSSITASVLKRMKELADCFPSIRNDPEPTQGSCVLDVGQPKARRA